MKILFVTTISNTVNLFLIPHIHFLIHQGVEVGVAFRKDYISPELKTLGCKIHEINFQRSPFSKDNFIAYKKIKRVVVEEKYDVIHVHTPVASFITRLACRNLDDISILYTAHGFHFYKGAPKKYWMIYYPLEKMAAKWTDGIITINEEDYQIAKKFRSKKNNVYKVHGVGINLQNFSPKSTVEKMNLRKQYKYEPNDFILLTVGELTKEKNQSLLLHAISLLKEKMPELKLLIVGDGKNREQLKEQTLRLGVEKMVDFLGYRNDIPQLMALSDVSVSTSRREGLPVNVMEAMATGLPLIVTDIRGNRDLVTDGVNGIVIDVDDVNGCANAIEKLKQSEQLRKKFSLKNRELIEKYSVERVVYELKTIYEGHLDLQFSSQFLGGKNVSAHN